MFDRFDICEAYYMYASEWHGGQWSDEYQIFGRLDAMGYRPSPILSKQSMSENARDILASLIRRTRRGERVVRGR